MHREENAPRPVGLEAVGVDPQVALRYAGVLDVRDAYNRPVSARLIGRQIRDAQAKAAEAVEAPARSARLRAVLRILEELVFAPFVLLPGPARPAEPEVQALARSLRPETREAAPPGTLRLARAAPDFPASLSGPGFCRLAPNRRDVLRC